MASDKQDLQLVPDVPAPREPAKAAIDAAASEDVALLRDSTIEKEQLRKLQLENTREEKDIGKCHQIANFLIFAVLPFMVLGPMALVLFAGLGRLTLSEATLIAVIGFQPVGLGGLLLSVGRYFFRPPHQPS